MSITTKKTRMRCFCRNYDDDDERRYCFSYKAWLETGETGKPMAVGKLFYENAQPIRDRLREIWEG